MLKRIIAAALVLVASFSVSAQWSYVESVDKMTDQNIRHAYAITDKAVTIFVTKRDDGSLRLIVGRGSDGLWAPAINGSIEVRVDSNKLESIEFGPGVKYWFSDLKALAALHPVRENDFVSMYLGNASTKSAPPILRDMANGTTLKVRVSTFTSDRLYREISLEGAKDALMKLTGNKEEWFAPKESNKP